MAEDVQMWVEKQVHVGIREHQCHKFRTTRVEDELLLRQVLLAMECSLTVDPCCHDI